MSRPEMVQAKRVAERGKKAMIAVFNCRADAPVDLGAGCHAEGHASVGRGAGAVLRGAEEGGFFGVEAGSRVGAPAEVEGELRLCNSSAAIRGKRRESAAAYQLKVVGKVVLDGDQRHGIHAAGREFLGTCGECERADDGDRPVPHVRSEERRVGKECRSRWS